MIEKTLRHIGFRRIVRPFVESGFFSEDPLVVHGMLISPFDISRCLLQKAWALSSSEEEFTAMRLLIKGSGGTFRYDLIDSGDRERGITSMARLAGYPAAAAIHLFAQGMIAKGGISTPEEIGLQDTAANFVLNFLEERGIKFTCTFTA